MKRIALMCMIAAALLSSCGSRSAASSQTRTETPDTVSTVAFDADSAYRYVEQQLAFGPRVPATPEHKACRQWIVRKLREFGADTIIEQLATVTNPGGKKMEICNILARFKGTKSPGDRLLYLAHYDTRPHADAETDAERIAQPVPGANDGGSGVAVLLETARQLGRQRAERDIDLLFVDAEDGGNDNVPDSWALGSQYWSQHKPYALTPADPLPRFAVLVDLVGGIDAKFYPEYYSQQMAPQVVDLVWNAARKAGHAASFPTELGGGVTDDHIYINDGGIPAIDIIETNNPATGGFPPTWHTLDDDIRSIDRNTLRAVGETLMTVARQNI